MSKLTFQDKLLNAVDKEFLFGKIIVELAPEAYKDAYLALIKSFLAYKEKRTAANHKTLAAAYRNYRPALKAALKDAKENKVSYQCWIAANREYDDAKVAAAQAAQGAR